MLKLSPIPSPFWRPLLEIKVFIMTTQLVSIGNNQIPLVMYRDQPVVTFAMIDQVHQRPEGTARKRFAENRERFTEGRHYYLVDYKGLSVLRTEFPGVFGANAPQAMLVTERGYLKLVKTFSDDLAWDVQDQLIDGYFRAKPLTPTSDLDAMLQQHAVIGLALMEMKAQREAVQVIQQDMAEVRTDIADIKAALPSPKTHTTIRAFAAIHNIRLNPKTSQRLGKRCAHLALQIGRAINHIPDDLYGTVNAYPMDLVEQVFADELGNQEAA